MLLFIFTVCFFGVLTCSMFLNSFARHMANARTSSRSRADIAKHIFWVGVVAFIITLIISGILSLF